jgi:hypothetical protein
MTVPDPSTTVRLVEACRALSDLEGWSMLGAKIQGAREALMGGSGLSERDLVELEEYAARWRDLRGDLQAFYRLLAPTNETASVALWRILHGGPPLEGWQEARLAYLYTVAIGHAPAVELCPRRRR